MENKNSASNNNRYILWCESLQQKRFYSVCLSIIGRAESGDLTEAYADCNSTIEKGDCVACSMRDKESKSKESLFYIERNNMDFTEKRDSQIRMSPSYAKGWNSVGDTVSKSIHSNLPSVGKFKLPEHKSSLEPKMESSSFAPTDLLSEAIAGEIKKQEEISFYTKEIERIKAEIRIESTKDKEKAKALLTEVKVKADKLRKLLQSSKS